MYLFQYLKIEITRTGTFPVRYTRTIVFGTSIMKSSNKWNKVDSSFCYPEVEIKDFRCIRTIRWCAGKRSCNALSMFSNITNYGNLDARTKHALIDPEKFGFILSVKRISCKSIVYSFVRKKQFVALIIHIFTYPLRQIQFALEDLHSLMKYRNDWGKFVMTDLCYKFSLMQFTMVFINYIRNSLPGTVSCLHSLNWRDLLRISPQFVWRHYISASDV